MQPAICKARTNTGTKCTKKAGESGYCTIHENKNENDAKRKAYEKVIDVIVSTSNKKGWAARVETSDKDYVLGTIAVSKHFDHDEVRGLVHFTLDDGLTYRIEKTSFYAYGQKDLLEAISTQLGKIGWVSKKDKPDVPAPPKSDLVLMSILRNFEKIVRQLKRRHNNRAPISISDEYDVQDLLHALLRAYFEDVRPEEYTPSYAGSSSRVDFLLKKESSVVEVKMASARLGAKQLGEQLIIDIKKYQAHPDCKDLYCLVYDPDGNIHNPIGFENDLSGKHNTLGVHVVVVPH